MYRYVRKATAFPILRRCIECSWAV